MHILITAGPTHEPIDPIRYLGNRSSGKMGAALAHAAVKAGHQTMVILGPAAIELPEGVRRFDIQTAQQMFDAVLREFPRHDLLIMAAAVADYRPKNVSIGKLARGGSLTLELEATPDIVAAAGKMKLPGQRTVGFSLETSANLDRARGKLREKCLDLIVHNPAETIGGQTIEPTLIYADGRTEKLPSRLKSDFADMLIQRAVALFGH